MAASEEISEYQFSQDTKTSQGVFAQLEVLVQSLISPKSDKKYSLDLKKTESENFDAKNLRNNKFFETADYE